MSGDLGHLTALEFFLLVTGIIGGVAMVVFWVVPMVRKAWGGGNGHSAFGCSYDPEPLQKIIAQYQDDRVHYQKLDNALSEGIGNLVSEVRGMREDMHAVIRDLAILRERTRPGE